MLEDCNCTVREFELCVNLHSGDLVAQWKGVNRLYYNSTWGSVGAFRAFRALRRELSRVLKSDYNLDSNWVEIY